ncbi:MAG: cell division protein ZapE [Hyphomicrobiaceae bacterium]
MAALARYRQLVVSGELEPDAGQLFIAERLDALAAELAAMPRRRTGLFAIFDRSRSTVPPRGLYLYGGVGRGKTLLMDLFFDAVAFAPKRRIHFHEFMGEAHDLIGAARRHIDGDPIPTVGRQMAAEARLLCFDELHVTDIADAMILGRLFKVLFEDGVVVVATSNTPPADLYKNGLNRQLFLPFIDLIEDRMDSVESTAVKDFRLAKLAGRPLYFTPADTQARNALDGHWRRLTGGAPGTPAEIEVKSRKVPVPQAAMGVARFAFAGLCERPLGARDYLHIAHTFHTVLVDGIPILAPSRRDVARRFVALIDALYDNRVCLIASAAAEPALLYPAGDGSDLFRRTASRLMEMRSEAYLQERARRGRVPTTLPA